MFKSASNRNIRLQDNYQSSYKFQTNNQFEFEKSKNKRPYVKFDTQEGIQLNNKQSNNDIDCSSYKRRAKSYKTWAKSSDKSDIDYQQFNTPVDNILKQHKNYDYTYESNPKKFLNQKLFASSYHRPKQSNYDKTNYQLNIPRKQQNFSKGLGLSKQCKSMKTLPTFNPNDDQSLSKVKRNVKFQAYNELLKSSQQLLTKYNRIEQQKTKLKNDLKSQKQEHAKSSKRICFAQQEIHEQQNKSYKQIKINIKEPRAESKYQKNYEYNNKCLKKTDQISYKTKYEHPIYQKVKVKPLEDELSKTFAYSKKQEYILKQQSSNSYTSGFNLKSKSDKSVSLNDFELGKCLGQGAFGQVFPAKHKKTNMLVAIKKVKKESVKHMLDQFVQQIKIQMFLDHPNIVKLYGFFDDCLHFYIIMEYMEGGSLYSYIKKNKTLSIEETSSKLKEVCQGLKNMHDNSILHRDIKPENVVMTNGVCKLCDFGWSAVCKDRRTTYCGTLDYVSPEIIEGQGYDDCVDIWCIGVLTYELLVGKTPFYNISRKETMKKIMDCSLQYPQDLPQIAISFMKRILRKNPQERTDIDKILQDPFLKLGNQKKNFQ